MRLFDIFKKSKKSDSVASMPLDQLLGGISESSSGVNVTISTALDSAVVLACASVIANGLAQVPFRLYQYKDRQRSPARDLELYWLLEEGPNPYQSQFEFRETIGLHLALTGEAFIWKNRVRGKIVELLPLEPHRVSVMPIIESDGYECVYNVLTNNGKFVSIPQEDMWHLKWRGYDIIRGMPPVLLARDAIGLSIAADRFLGTSIKKGVRPSGLLTSSQKLDEKAQKELRESWETTYGGSSNAGRIIILGQELKYQAMSMTNQDAQFLENREYQVTELCRYWNVMPIMVYSYVRTTTYSSAEQLFLQHKVHTLDPWYRRIETSANKYLLSEAQRRNEGLYFKFIDDGLLRGDAKSRSEAHRSAIVNGYKTPNEVRELEEMNPLPGGDELYMQGAMNTLGNIIAGASDSSKQVQDTGPMAEDEEDAPA